jgi:hypothetical protein
VVLLIITRARIELGERHNRLIAAFAEFFVPLVIPSTEWMMLNVPIHQDNGSADDSAQILQASLGSAVADSKQTFPSSQKVLDQAPIM